MTQRSGNQLSWCQNEIFVTPRCGNLVNAMRPESGDIKPEVILSMTQWLSWEEGKNESLKKIDLKGYLINKYLLWKEIFKWSQNLFRWLNSYLLVFERKQRMRSVMEIKNVHSCHSFDVGLSWHGPNDSEQKCLHKKKN